MSLEQTLEDITSRLKDDAYPNEQAICQGVVLRILHELGWNIYDTKIVWPEYGTGEGRADFALCHPPSKPAVLIEVKQPGRAEDSVRQALEYAFHTGVPFIVLTDGRTWSFYLPSEQGTYEDRRVYKLDLFERSADQAADALDRYLAYTRVQHGESLETAKKEYRDRNRRSQAQADIPSAWDELVEKGDERLVDILASAVESRVGIRPTDDDVLDFFSNSLNLRSSTVVSTDQVPAVVNHQGRQSVGVARGRRGSLTLFGRQYEYRNANEAMVIVLRELAKRDPSFLEKCSRHPNMRGHSRKYIARTPEELYPDSPSLRDLRQALPGGWFVLTDINNHQKKAIIKIAAEVAGLTWDRDIRVDLG